MCLYDEMYAYHFLKKNFVFSLEILDIMQRPVFFVSVFHVKIQG